MEAIRFADAVAVDGNGKICISEALTRFPAAAGVNGCDDKDVARLDILENAAMDRILEYDPANQANRIVAKRLSLANSAAFSGDEKALFVAETDRYRV